MVDGEKIRRLREASGMTMDELAQEVGLSFQMMSYIERNLRDTTAEKLKRIADKLGVKVDELYTDSAQAQNN